MYSSCDWPPSHIHFHHGDSRSGRRAPPLTGQSLSGGFLTPDPHGRGLISSPPLHTELVARCDARAQIDTAEKQTTVRGGPPLFRGGLWDAKLYSHSREDLASAEDRNTRLAVACRENIYNLYIFFFSSPLMRVVDFFFNNQDELCARLISGV